MPLNHPNYLITQEIIGNFSYSVCLVSVGKWAIVRKFYAGLQRYPKLLSELEHEFRRVVPTELFGHNESLTDKILDSIRAFYFQQRPVDNRNIDSLIDLFTDVMFLRPVLEIVRQQEESNPGNKPVVPVCVRRGSGSVQAHARHHAPGACHGDEMGYPFYFSKLNYRLDDDSPELAVSRRTVQMWTNFAKTGNPTPPVDYESVVDFEWLQVNDTEHMNYLDINGNFTVQTNPEVKRVKFWNWLYDNYLDKQETNATVLTKTLNTTEATNTTIAANVTAVAYTTIVTNTTVFNE